MFKLQITKLADVLIEKGISENEDKEIIVYGLASGMELVFNIITTIILGLIFGLFMESFVFLISFSFIRIYAGGYHCQKAINCYFFSSGIVVLVLFIIKFTPKWYILAISLVILLISVPIILKLAPVETKTKPLDELEQKHYGKKTIIHLSIECVVILILFIADLPILAFVICLGVVVVAVLVLFG